jgi:hypothetical protein
MFALTLTLAALSTFNIAAAVPTGLVARADWKSDLGWDGKVITPVDLDPSNAVKPTPGVSTLSESFGLF